MIRINSYVLLVVVLTCLGASALLAQGQTQPQQAPKPAETSTMEDVSKWTQKQWTAAKAKWSKKKTQWNDCQAQAKAKSLSGRKSWQFLYDCMTK